MKETHPRAPNPESDARRADTQPIRIRTKNPLHLHVEGAARMEGLSLGLVHGRPPLVGCVRQIALTCGFTSPVQSRTQFRTATDQKVGSSSLSGRALSAADIAVHRVLCGRWLLCGCLAVATAGNRFECPADDR